MFVNRVKLGSAILVISQIAFAQVELSNNKYINNILSADSIKTREEAYIQIDHLNRLLESDNYETTIKVGLLHIAGELCSRYVDSACLYLNGNDQSTDIAKYVYTDPDFEKFYNSSFWNNLMNMVDSSFLSHYPSVQNPQLAVELYHILLKDQKGRGMNFKNKLLNNNQNDSINLIQVEKIISENGWPTYSMVGEESASGAFLVIQHSDVNTQMKYLKHVYDAALKNEASKEWIALLMDRISVVKRGVQIFGTQLYQANDQDNFGKKIFKYFPIRDELHVDSLRKELGLIPLKEYYAKYGIDYKPGDR
jgi:hypothetical protein